MKRILVFVTLLLLTCQLNAQFLRASGRQILNDKNEVVLLRGIGLGGWMLQEPYMLEMSGIAGTQHEIRAKIEALIGTDKTAAFYDAWLANHCTKRDIDSLAAWGFNSVRLPMHYNLFTLPVDQEPIAGSHTWLDKGFALTDSLIKWCAANKMYVILDLHAAPGGQGRDAAISDYDSSKPSLWESTANRNKTVALWKKLAERYASEPWVGGYDLLNEPNWNFTTGANQNGCNETANVPMWDLYRDIIAAIRTVDHQHMVIVEGNCWGNNHNGFTNLDNNMVASFHKYWSNNDAGSISGILNLSTGKNVPIWMGESGENSNQWARDAIKLVEGYGIGWAWWPLKKVNSIVNPLTVKGNGDYESLLTWWKYGGQGPTVDVATNALMKLADNLKTSRTIAHPDFVDAMFRQTTTNDTKPFRVHTVPGVVALTDFDLGSNGYAYQDADIANYQVSTGTYTTWNQGWAYRNDGVDIETTADNDERTNGFDVGWTAAGEWMQYTLRVDSTAAYNVQVRYAAQNNGSALRLSMNGRDLAPPIALPATGGYQSWSEVTLNDVLLYKGTQPLRVYITQGGMNLGFVTFTLSKKYSEVAFKAVSAQTDAADPKVFVNVNKPLPDATINASQFHLKANGAEVSLLSVARSPVDSFQLVMTTTSLTDADVLLLSYAGTEVKASDGSALEAFTDLAVTNRFPVHLAIPGTIQAEQFAVNQGWSVEACTDNGGGSDMGYTNTGDRLIYDVRVDKTATYKLEVRSACNANAGIIDIEQLDANNLVLNTVRVNIPVTGGWQSWTTVKTDMPLTAGMGKLRVTVVQPEFNLNWYRFTEVVVSGTEPIKRDWGVLYPNPAADHFFVSAAQPAQRTVIIRSATGQTVHTHVMDAADQSAVDASSLAEGFYVVETQQAGKSVFSRLIIRR
ncbi:MAG: carbohydrate-binding protein [Cyclobacteriaceae bacterium]|nr:carbohydrate-binding protein [Cyclobacteriaceae bacterium]